MLKLYKKPASILNYFIGASQGFNQMYYLSVLTQFGKQKQA